MLIKYSILCIKRYKDNTINMSSINVDRIWPRISVREYTLKSKHLSHASHEEIELHFVWKWNRLKHSDIGSHCPEYPNRLPLVVEENGLVVKKRLALLPKAIGVSPLFIGMILPTPDSVDQIQYEARKRDFFFFFRTILRNPHDSNTNTIENHVFSIHLV